LTYVNVGGKAMSSAKRFDPGRGSYYGIKRIHRYIKEEKIFIHPDAERDAKKYFGWTSEDILKAVLKLQSQHCTKKVPLDGNPDIPVEHYKARKIMGEDIYTHLHKDPDEDVLLIRSFKHY